MNKVTLLFLEVNNSEEYVKEVLGVFENHSKAHWEMLVEADTNKYFKGREHVNRITNEIYSYYSEEDYVKVYIEDFEVTCGEGKVRV